MKVEKIGTRFAEPLTRVGVETSEEEVTQKLFHRELNQVLEGEEQAYLDEKIQQITEQGNKLCEKADLAQLNKYKEMIRELIHHTVNNGYQFSKSNRFDSRGRGKVYALIKKVNVKLDDLTQQVLSDEKENIDLVAQVNDIRGLLVDMFL